jgi:hypothetical protein
MFHVIVLGGIGLVGLDGCGRVSDGGGGPGLLDSGSDAHVTVDAFPSETAARLDAFPSETATIADAFPAETATQLDAFPNEGPAHFDAFPSESDTPPPESDAGCFPDETAFVGDAGACGQGGK